MRPYQVCLYGDKLSTFAPTDPGLSPGDFRPRHSLLEAGELHPGKKSYPTPHKFPGTESINGFGLAKCFKLELVVTSYMLSTEHHTEPGGGGAHL